MDSYPTVDRSSAAVNTPFPHTNSPPVSLLGLGHVAVRSNAAPDGDCVDSGRALNHDPCDRIAPVKEVGLEVANPVNATMDMDKSHAGRGSDKARSLAYVRRPGNIGATLVVQLRSRVVSRRIERDAPVPLGARSVV